MPLSPFSWFLSFLPVLCVMVLMLGFKWGGTRASAVAWITAALISLLAFGGTWEMLAYTQVKSILLSLDVLYIVWSALLLYNLAKDAGAIDLIGKLIPTISDDRGLQILLVAWLMTSFLQGMGGFGVPIAICAPILVGMGFSPIKAVVMAAIGHGWAVNFGSMAAAFQALLAVTGVSGFVLAPFTAILLGLTLIPTAVIITVIGTGWKGLKHTLPAIVLVSLVMGVAQYYLATSGLWNMATTGAALLGLVTMLLLTRLPRYRKTTLPKPENNPVQMSPRLILVMVSPYLILMVLGFAIILIKPLNNWLNQVSLSLMFPEIQTLHGWTTSAGEGKIIQPFSHPGSILLYSCLISSLIYRSKGILKTGATWRILSGVLHSSVDASLGVIAMVGVAGIMTHSGMTNLLARGLSESINKVVYPAIAPFIGVLGAFLTGSNNNSNVLFAQLQMETATLMKLSVPLILSAQTAGGSLGSIMSPAKVIVGCSTVGLNQQEGVVLRNIVIYGLIPVVIVAIATTIWSLALTGG
ncbi:MAG: L-lactate permease [Anaerolineaceae bacterium]